MLRKVCPTWQIVLLWSWAMAPSLEAARPEVSVERTGTNVTIHFTGKLQRADRVKGPYLLLPEASSPWVASAGGDEQFWRAWLSGVNTIAAGSKHTVALRADGTLWAWGANGSGQLGNGTSTSTNIPQPVLGGAVWNPPP